jgi:hypothetical protein
VEDEKGKEAAKKAVSGQGNFSVRRSQVPAGLKYPQYRKYLQYDFLHSCAYCTITEAEATGKRLTIDHYEPKSLRPDLQDEYSNLIYACEDCNTRKGPRVPTEQQRDEGVRFFRPDLDSRDDHFQQSGIRIESLSPIGKFTVDGISLNRGHLLKLRQLREELWNTLDTLTQNLTELQEFPLDQLRSYFRPYALQLIKQMFERKALLEEDFIQLLREYARNPLDDDADSLALAEDKQGKRERTSRLRDQGGIHAEHWSGPKRNKRATRRG